MKILKLSYVLAFALSFNGSYASAQDQQPGSKAPKGTTAEKQLRSPDVVYVPTPAETVDAMLKVAKVGKEDVVYD